MRHSCPTPPAGPAEAAADSHQERLQAVALQCMHIRMSGCCSRIWLTLGQQAAGTAYRSGALLASSNRMQR